MIFSVFTESGLIAYVKEICPVLKSVDITKKSNGIIEVLVRLPWYYWFALGILHLKWYGVIVESLESIRSLTLEYKVIVE
jgi:hypothetical protein